MAKKKKHLKNTAQFSASFLLPHYWPIWFGVGILWLIHLLPRSSQFYIGKKLGDLLHRLAGKRRELAFANVSLAFPDKTEQQRRDIVRQHFQSVGISFIELAIIWWGRFHFDDNNNESKYVTFKNVENLREVEKNTNGSLIILPHFTHVDTTNLYFSFLSPGDSVYRPNDNKLLDYLILKARSLGKRNHGNIPFNDTRAMIRALRKGRNIGYLPDQRYRGPGHIMVPFFGMDAKSHSATSKIAKITGCSVILVFTKRIADQYEISFSPVLESFPSGDEYQDTLRLHKMYEQAIKENPSQYLWVHNRWDLKWDKQKKAYIKKD